MIGTSLHTHDAMLIAAVIAALGGMGSAWLTYLNRKAQDTGNGHTIGRGVARIEDQMREHENRLDRIEVHTVEQLAEIKERLASAVFEKERHMATYRHDRRLVDE